MKIRENFFYFIQFRGIFIPLFVTGTVIVSKSPQTFLSDVNFEKVLKFWLDNFTRPEKLHSI